LAYRVCAARAAHSFPHDALPICSRTRPRGSGPSSASSALPHPRTPRAGADAERRASAREPQEPVGRDHGRPIEEQEIIVDASVASITAWTFVEECPIPEDVTALLVPEERAIAAYKTCRDSAVFTTKRLIVRDAQGIRGKKVEIYSLPYSAINMWSSENAGTLDLNAE